MRTTKPYDKWWKQSYTDKISPRSIHIYTPKKRKRGKINISCSHSPPAEFGMSPCLFRYSTDAGTSSGLWSFNPLLLRLLGEISLSLLCTSPGVQLWFGPTSACRSPEGVCSSVTQDGVKGAADSGALAHSGQGEAGVWMPGEPVAAEAGVTLLQPEAQRVFSQGSCPWLTRPWQWWAAQAPRRGGLDSDLCSLTGFLVTAAAALASHARLWGPHW